MKVFRGLQETENPRMPTLVIDNVPEPLLERIQHRARLRQQRPAETVLEVLESAFCQSTPTFSPAPVPQEPFVTEEIGAPCSIPRPQGRPARSVRVAAPLPSPHDLPDAE